MRSLVLFTSDQEAQVQRIAEDIRNGNIGHFQNFLQTSIEEGTDENSEQRAKELLVKLAEYKPLAKIEEMEEQNYNMIDNVHNNGVEKFNRKEDKQKLQQGRTSLKERLCTKQCEVSEKQVRDPQDQNIQVSLSKADIIEPVSGHGKGKYKFKK